MLNSTDWRSAIYAIVLTGGKQYRVEPGQALSVERLEAPVGSKVELTDVLLVGDGSRVVVGSPTVPEAKVVASVLGEGKGDKVVIFKYKNKTRYRRKRGHRQFYTRLAIEEIILPEGKPATEAEEGKGEEVTPSGS